MTFEYPLMDPSYQVKDYYSMTKVEAKAMYEWFISEIPNRVYLLTKYFDLDTKASKGRLDYTPESLIRVWEWFMTKITTRDLITEEIELYNSTLPEWARSTSKTTLSLESRTVGVDIGIYLGETFVKNFEEISWGIMYTPKSFMHVNKPLLRGFGKVDAMNPISAIEVAMLKYIENPKENNNNLYELFNCWKEYIIRT